MQVSVETTSGLERKMRVQVPADRVDGEVESRLRNLARQVRLDGFRPGKVPFKVVRQRYGGQVRQEVLNEVLQQTYGEALEQEKLNPAGAPAVDLKQGMDGGDLEYEATFEVMPEVEVQGTDALKLERPVAEVTDEDISRVLEDLRKQQAKYNTVERPAQERDRVLVDFKGTIDGEDFPGNEGEDQPVTIGSNTMPREFEQALVGVSAGEEKDIDYTFADDFPTESVRGKTAIFKTQVKAVEEPELPELDDDLAVAVGIAEGGLEALRQLIRQNLENEASKATQAQLKEQVTEQLGTANAELTLPKALVDGEIKALQQQMKQRIQQQTGQEDDDFDLPGELFEEQARRRVRLGLLMNRLISKNEIKLDQDKARARLQEMAANYPNPQEVIQYYTQNRQLMQSLEVSVLEDQVIDWLIEQAETTDKSLSLDELLKPRQSKQADDAEDESTADTQKSGD
ncbi:trigger factor [Natronocella acetinitrilica]|jgi:trigger factor|uniref:Trigger factor n=1 Tax=Natronocella acetinitrilica TaxID=414046 RepID=A0AAE3G616_9GAMM|nr:trigger factor [Natronocella acetinitrilica]MCP1676314.1 trigger factor [Natronocella acetinitrilica]